MKGLIAIYIESKKLEKDINNLIKKYNMIQIPMLILEDSGPVINAFKVKK